MTEWFWPNHDRIYMVGWVRVKPGLMNYLAQFKCVSMKLLQWKTVLEEETVIVELVNLSPHMLKWLRDIETVFYNIKFEMTTYLTVHLDVLSFSQFFFQCQGKVW